MNKINLAIVENRNDLLENRLDYFMRDKELFSNVYGFNCLEDMLAAKHPLNNYILLLDINLPGISVIEGIPLLKKKFHNLEILMISVLSDSENVFNAILLIYVI